MFKKVCNILFYSFGTSMCVLSVYNLINSKRLYKIIKYKKIDVKEIINKINNFKEDQIKNHKDIYLIDDKHAYFYANFDSQIENKNNENIFNLKNIYKILENKRIYKSSVNNFDLVDPYNKNYKIKDILNYTSFKFNFDIKKSLLPSLNLSKMKNKRKYDNIFDYLKLIFTNKLNFNISVTENNFSLYSNSKLFIVAKIIFNYKNLKISDINLLGLSNDKKNMFKYLFNKTKTNLFIFIIFSSYLIYTIIKKIKDNYEFNKLNNTPFLKTDNEELSCIICYDFMKNIIFLPCRHLSVCELCYKLANNKLNCFICKKLIKEILILKNIK